MRGGVIALGMEMEKQHTDIKIKTRKDLQFPRLNLKQKHTYVNAT